MMQEAVQQGTGEWPDQWSVPNGGELSPNVFWISNLQREVLGSFFHM